MLGMRGSMRYDEVKYTLDDSHICCTTITIWTGVNNITLAFSTRLPKALQHSVPSPSPPSDDLLRLVTLEIAISLEQMIANPLGRLEPKSA